MKTQSNNNPILTVLSLEDSFRDFEIIRESLTDAGYALKMDHAENGPDFVMFLQKQTYDLILADFSLPGYDAFSALNKTLEICPDVPFIVVSGSIGEETAIDLIRQGAVDYILKDRLERLPAAAKRALDEAAQKKVQKQMEQSLAANYALLRIAGETAKFGGWSVDIPEYTALWSDTVADIHEMPRGYSPTVIDAINFYAPEWRERITKLFKNCARNGIPYDEEIKILTRSGKRVWVRTNGVAVRDEAGKIVKVQGSFQDISEKKRTEEALQDSETQFRTMIDAAPLAITRNDPDGRIQSWNRAAEKIFGWTETEALGNLPPYVSENRMEEFQRLRKQVIQGKVLTQIEVERQRKDGTLIQVNFSTGALFDKTGKVTGYIAILEDITERKQSEAERERLLAAIEQSDESIIITDPSGVVQYVNPAFERISGFKKEEICGQTPSILKSGKQDEAFYSNLWTTLLAGHTFKSRIINKRKDGSLFTEDASISPVFNPEGHIVNFVAVKRDITAHIQLEAQFHQAQKMESVGRLAGGVAHDFNNMLTIIMSYTQMAMKAVDPSGPIYKDLEQVDKAAGKSTDITRRLLAFARRQAVTPKILDLNETLESMLKMIRRLIGENIELIWCPSPALWPVMADPAQIDQILANLCVNAGDAIDGTGRLTIETFNTVLDEAYCHAHPGFYPGRFVMLSVSDTGSGMSKEILEQIFEPFFTTKEAGLGTGLGLATVYGIVKQNKGFINVYSEPGEGTTFKIYLPQHTGSTTGPLKIWEDKKPAMGRGETILVIEDETAILELIQKILSELNYVMLEASTPTQALILAEKHAGKIHLVLTDMVMPEMSGRDLARKLKILYPELKMAFMSGYTADVIHRQSESKDHIPFIQKPFTLKEIALKIREALDGHSFSGSI